jgi:hypothetical protein
MHAPAPCLGLLLWSALVGAWLVPAAAAAAGPERPAVVCAPAVLPDEIETALSAAVGAVATAVSAGEGCGAGDGACLATRARAAGARGVLHASVRPVGGTPSLTLTLVDAGDGSTARAVEPLRPGVPVEPAVREAVFRLLAPERVVGALEVVATDGSEIWIDGVRRGVAPLPAIEDLAPGQHLLRVVRPGGGEARGTVEVRFEARTRVRVEPRSDELVLLAHERAPGEAGGPGERRAGSGDTGSPGAVELAAAGAVSGDAIAIERPARDRGAAVDLLPGDGPAPNPNQGPSQVPPAALAEPEPRPFPVWTVAGWSALGTGGALALGAVLPALAAASARDDARALRDADGRLPPARAAEDRRLAADAAAHDRTAAILLGVGTSLLVGGAAVLLLDLDDPGPREAP